MTHDRNCVDASRVPSPNHRIVLRALLLTALPLPIQGSSATVEARPIRGAVIRGELRSLNGASVVLERPSEGAQTLPTRDLLGLQFVRGDARAPSRGARGTRCGSSSKGEIGSRARSPAAPGTSSESRSAAARSRSKSTRSESWCFPSASRGDSWSRLPREHRSPLQAKRDHPDGEPVLEPVNGTVISFQDTGVEFEGVFGKSVFPWDRIAILIVSPIGDKANPEESGAPDAIVALVPDGRLRVRLGSVADGALKPTRRPSAPRDSAAGDSWDSFSWRSVRRGLRARPGRGRRAALLRRRRCSPLFLAP
mgnify:CR=1 FL=1